MNSSLFRGRPWLAKISLGTALAATALFGLKAATAVRENPAATIKTINRSEAASGRGYSGVVKRVIPAVVNISSSRVIKGETGGQGMRRHGQGQGQGEGDGQGMDPFFRQFFGDNFSQRFAVPKDRVEKALGSGVIVSPEGYVLTNNHVVDHATEVTVTLHDKREMKARVVGTDARTDIAVLKLEGSNFPYLTLADSTKVEVGDIVLAIGDPFGVGQTVTSGIVSATGRSGLGIEEVEDFIQTDAPINPGNSGGALVDDEGHLIGINTAIVAGNSGGNQGIGFAVPINMARHDMDQILEHGKVERAYLGIVPQDIKPALAKAFNVSETGGALVGDVSAGGPAEKGGLQKGDIILDINGQPIADANQLRLKVGMMMPNETVKMKVLRNGKTLEVAVKLGEFPANQERASIGTEEKESVMEGVTVENLTPEQANQLKLSKATTGVVVDEVSPASRAANAGLQPGDVIQEVNHHSVQSVGDFKQAINSTSKDTPVLLLVNREGSTMFLAV
jgi:serine protease Do